MERPGARIRDRALVLGVKFTGLPEYSIFAGEFRVTCRITGA